MRGLGWVLLFLLVSPLAAVAAPVDADTALAAIVRAEDARTSVSLERFLHHPDAVVRARAVRALGRIQDPSLIGWLMTASRDASPMVRREAIFALGQLPPSSFAQESLCELLDETKSFEERRAAVIALGRVAQAQGAGVDRLLRFLGDADPSMRAAAALALEDLAYRARRVSPPWTPPISVAEALIALLSPSQPCTVRVAAAGALMRLAWLPAGAPRVRPAWSGQAVAALLPLLHETEAQVRLVAVQAIGEVAAPDGLPTEIGRRLEDADWRVRVAAVEAIARAAAPRAWPVLLAQQLQDPHPLVVLASVRALEALARRHGTGIGAEVYGVYLDRRRPMQVRAEALRVAVAFQAYGPFPAPQPFGGAGPPSPRSGVLQDDWKGQWPLRRALVQGSADFLASAPGGLSQEAVLSQYAATVEPFLHDADQRVRAAAVEATGALLTSDSSRAAAAQLREAPARARLCQDLMACLGDADLIVQVSAADVLSQCGAGEAVPRVMATLETLQPDRDVEAMSSLVEALGRFRDPRALPALQRLLDARTPVLENAAAKAIQEITGTAPARIKTPHESTGIAPDALARATQAARGQSTPLRAVVHTAHGDMTIRLLPEQAPLTVSSFVTLARRGYYDGLSFHRVVPNFVVQGGDPRGDGWGGPGFCIRCEYSPVAYGRGTVGMALAGKDTGGSQFFITHSPQPRLVGRYTVFGQVVDGLDVLDRITEGDQMRIEIREP